MEVHKSAARVFGVNPCRRRNEIFRRARRVLPSRVGIDVQRGGGVVPRGGCRRAQYVPSSSRRFAADLPPEKKKNRSPPSSPSAGWKRFFTASRRRLTLWMGSDSPGGCSSVLFASFRSSLALHSPRAKLLYVAVVEGSRFIIIVLPLIYFTTELIKNRAA